MKSLHELTADLLALYDIEDIDQDAFNDTLEGMVGTFEVKIERIAKMIENMQAEKDMVTKKRQQLAQREQRLAKRLEWLKRYMLSNMLVTGIDRVATDDVLVRLVGKAKAVVWGDPALIPDCVKKTPKPIPNSTLAKEYIAEHGDQPWARLDEGKRVDIK
jgi:hypothetical protein